MTSRAAYGPWFIAAFPKPETPFRLFCLPYAGGGASIYVQWARAFRDQPVEVCAVQLPGRENRLGEIPFTDMSSAIAGLVPAILPLLDRPYALFGHSMGATMAFELSRALADAGHRLPHHLFVSGADAPHIVDDHEPLARIDGDLEFVTAVAERFGGVPQIVLENEELRSMIAPALRGDLQLHESYRYVEGAPLPVAVTAYGGTGDEFVPEASVLAWQRHTSAQFSSRFFEGGHFFVNDARDQVIAAVKTSLGYRSSP